MKKPYQASNDKTLYLKLKSLHRCGIKPNYIETDGSILIEIGSKIDAYIDECGIELKPDANQRDISISTETLMQLASMSTCFAAGYAKARQEHEEKQTANQ